MTQRYSMSTLAVLITSALAVPAAAQVQVVEAGSAEAPQPVGGRGIEYGAHLIVPVYLGNPTLDLPTEPEVALGLGIGFQGRLGFEFPGGLTLEGNVGVLGNNVDEVGALSASNTTLVNVWVGLGGRFSFLNPSALVPFVGAGIAANLWSVSTDKGGTVESSESEFAFGFNALGGIAYELSPELAAEFGVQVNYSLAPESFSKGFLFVTPFLGGTLYY